MIHVFFSAESFGVIPYSFLVMPVTILFIFLEIFLLGRREGRYVEWLNVVASSIIVLLTALTFLQLMGKPKIDLFLGGWAPPYGIQISTFLFNSTILFFTAYCFLVISLITKNERIPLHAYPLFLFMFLGAFGVILSADLFNIFVYFEIMSIASYILVASSGRSERFTSAFNYLVAGAVMTSFYLLGVVLIYGVYGTLNLYDLSSKISELGLTQPAIFASIFLLAAMFFKSAIFPFYFWKPLVMNDTNHAMRLFLGTVSPIIPFYIAIRFLEIFNDHALYLPLSIFGGITMVVASLLAIYSRRLMEVLAYASIFQTGLLFTAYGLGYSYGIMKSYALMHLISMYLFELLIFGSLAFKHILSGNFSERFLALGLMGSAGMPFTAGFVPKIMIVISSLNVGYALFFFFLFLFVLSAVYSLKAYTLYSEHRLNLTGVRDTSSSICLLALASAFLILLGLYPNGMIYIADLLLFSLRSFGV